jgi:hypothetical protein
MGAEMGLAGTLCAVAVGRKARSVSGADRGLGARAKGLE